MKDSQNGYLNQSIPKWVNAFLCQIHTKAIGYIVPLALEEKNVSLYVPKDVGVLVWVWVSRYPRCFVLS